MSDIYEDNLYDSKADYSAKGLKEIPDFMCPEIISTLYLQNNEIRELPDSFFPSLPSLQWLDLRDNEISHIPETIKFHPSLTHLLLQNNNIISLPNELGTLPKLKSLQVSKNPICYPPDDVLESGIKNLLDFLRSKFKEAELSRLEPVSSPSLESQCDSGLLTEETNKKQCSSGVKSMSVLLNDKDNDDSGDEKPYKNIKSKCHKLQKARELPKPVTQSSKYLKPLRVSSSSVSVQKLIENHKKEIALEKHKVLLAKREKILQDRKTFELVRQWRQGYRQRQLLGLAPEYAVEAGRLPYATSPEHMRFLTRDDLEGDLPDKYRRSLTRRCRPSAPRKKPADVHLAQKIKMLFENLEAISLNRSDLTPRSEQKVLREEIQKITEIKEKLAELRKHT